MKNFIIKKKQHFPVKDFFQSTSIQKHTGINTIFGIQMLALRASCVFFGSFSLHLGWCTLGSRFIKELLKILL